MLRQPAYIVVGLDFGGYGIARALALDHIGVERSLRQKIHGAYARRLFVEYADELFADDFALSLRVGHAAQRADKALGGVCIH